MTTDRDELTSPAVGLPLDARVGRLQPERVNSTSGDTLCTVRWMVETPAGWLGAYNREAFDAYAAAAVDAERARCIAIIAAYRVPVGNSRAGELAAEWTLDALREVRDEIRKQPNVAISGGR